ncbi:MAG: orotate phosphoribosyltransferase [Chloroflexi bacterium]|nr:orotate phosphoribosyltransferase [Chloroflexota bacterium]
MSDKVMQIFKDAGAVLEGHFLLTSGLHSAVYWEKFRVLQYPQHTVKLCSLITERFKKDSVQVVAGPTTGGIILAYEVARQLGVRDIFAEKEGDKRAFRRGFTIAPGERVLIVDDVLTTGGSIQGTIEAVNELKGKIVGIGVLLDRTEQQKDFGVPLFSCLRAATQAYKPSECPLCTAGVPLVRPGS